MNYIQGRFLPKNPQKYIGSNVDNIIYRSSWELRMNQFLDQNKNVLEWCSECIVVKYIKPTDRKLHRYFVDYYVKYVDKRGNIKQQAIEIKPRKETRRPTSRNFKKRVYEEVTYAINMSKWAAAKKFCDKYNIEFKILSENELFK